jgi:prolipoprotein diacylglyceryl transferase
VWAVLLGFVGARLAYASTHLDRFEGRPLAVLAIWEGGLALFGGLTVGVVVGVLLVRRWGGDVPRFADAVAPAIPLAQAIGRWGNYFNQELFGTPSDLPWAVEIDPVNRPAAFADAATFHPTFLYESIYNLLVVVVLLRVERRTKLKPGNLLLVYGMLYGVGRFLLELIRTDTTFRLFGLSRNALVALAVVVGSGLLLRHRQRTAPQTSLLDEQSPEAAEDVE